MKDKTTATLANEDVRSAFAYAGCKAKHENVVGLFDELRQQFLDYIKSINSLEKPK